MDLDSESDSEKLSTSSVKCFDFGCSCKPILNRSFSGTMLHSIKRKYNEYDTPFAIMGSDLHQNARVEIRNECVALREMVSGQQKSIQDLSFELDEERNAACSAANEVMSMILRLQREKAEVLMEARQFKMYVEAKTAHYQHELEVFQDLLCQREEFIHSLTCEIRMYKHRMLSFGLLETDDIEAGLMGWNNKIAHTVEYPSLTCNVAENQLYSDVDDEAIYVEKYAHGDTPHSRDQLKDLEYRINLLEKTPRCSQPLQVIVGKSLNFTMESPRLDGSSRKKGHPYPEDFSNLRKYDNASDAGDVLMENVYDVDSVYPDVTTPMYSMINRNVVDPDIQKLYTRLHALEADKESMKQSLISMRTGKAHLARLKEVSQELLKEMSPQQRKSVKKPSLIGGFSLISFFKVIVSLILWGKKARRSKYMCGFTDSNVGLLMLISKGQIGEQWVYHSSKRL